MATSARRHRRGPPFRPPGYRERKSGQAMDSQHTQHIPSTGYDGVIWPAVPPRGVATIFALLCQFEHSQWWPAETLIRHQLRQLASLAGHAARTVPFYRERLDCLAGIGPGELTMDKWREVPLLHRRELQDAGKEICSSALPKDHLPLGEISTSGSTGTPVTVQTTRMAQTLFGAAQLRFHLWHRRDFAAKACAIRVLNSGESGKVVNWVIGYRSGPMAIFDISRPVSEQFEWLVKEAPAYLLTYPNNLQALIELSEKTGTKIPNLREVATMSEVLDPELRSECRRVWDVPVADGYSAMEIGILALQCPEHPTYHVQSECVCLEILDQDGAPCGPGQVGRVVVTQLHNFDMPLIRYEIGDYAEVGAPCSCGRGLPVLNRILGRSRNMLILPSGDRLWPRFSAASLSKDYPVRQVQMVQVSLAEIDVNLVVSRPLTDGEESALRERFGTTLGYPFALKFNYVDDIPRAANGKFEDFRCDLEI